MSFQDKLIHCSTCGATFTFSAEKQEFFKNWGIPGEPKQCSSCRSGIQSNKHRSSSYSGTTNRVYQATCADCGKKTNLPFEPRSGRRVYCSDCYRKVKQLR
jgi:CxxC-x17-CxxC domain-containing protein